MDENFDFGGAVDKLKDMFSSEEGSEKLRGILNMFQNSSDDTSETKSDNSFDPALLLKLAKILSAVNSSETNEKTQLLMALKPFLKENRREKVDKAVQLMNVSKVFSAFKEM